MFNTADKLQFSDSLILLVHHLAKIINYHLEVNGNITKSNLQLLQVLAGTKDTMNQKALVSSKL